MIPALSFVFMAISILLSVGLPVVLTIWVMKKYKPGFWAVASGIIVFVVLQVLIRMNILLVFALSDAGKAFIENNTLLYIVILALSAGIVEEFGRYFAFKVMLKNRHGYGHGLAYGIGHGGIEAIVLIGLAYMTNIIVGIISNSGMLPALGAFGKSIAPAINLIANTPPLNFLLGGIERVLAICFHVALSILVLYGVRKRNIAYTLLAVLVHALVNFGSAIVMQELGAITSEVFLFIVAVASVVFIVLMKRVFEKQDASLQQSV